MSYKIEIAVTDYKSALAAVNGGADRIELCCALSEGGLTPSYALIEACKNSFNIPVFPIIRPRAGDFLYNNAEFEIVKKDALICKQSGCEGIVTGFLLTDGSIDKERTAAITQLVYPVQVTFHRAFDRCRDPLKALEDIIEAGCTRILTSGQKPKAPEGAGLIRQLIEAAKGRIIIMPGSGVRKENIKALANKTGATEFHGSLRSVEKSSMSFIHPAFTHLQEDYSNATVLKEEVEALRAALKTQ